MSYLKIPNLYKNQDILLFKECYALEKIHGTSAHISFSKDEMGLPRAMNILSGGEKYERFAPIFNEEKLTKIFIEMDINELVIFGEAYGGSQQAMSHTYGKELKFVVFDVKLNDNWLTVPEAEAVATKFGLEFVHYWKVQSDTYYLNKLRDSFSPQAKRNGIDDPKIMEGIVLRPLIEVKRNNGSRIIAKHKRDDFRETKTPREVDPEKLKVLEGARSIAEEWVTMNRLDHVIDQYKRLNDGEEPGLERMKQLLILMVDDVKIESSGEVVWTKEAEKAIASKTAALFKQKLQDSIN